MLKEVLLKQQETTRMLKEIIPKQKEIIHMLKVKKQ